MKTAELFDHGISGADVQVIGIAEHHLCLNVTKILRRESSLDGSRCCDIHENRSLNRAMHRGHVRALGSSVRIDNFIRIILLWHILFLYFSS